MLTPDVRFEGFTGEDWQRVLGLIRPGAAHDPGGKPPRGGLFIVHEGGAIKKILHSQKGRLDPKGAWPVPLPELCEAHQADWAVAVYRGALEECMERFGARARRDDDLTAQALSLVSIVREMFLEGAIEAWPRRLRGVPVPSEAMVRRATGALFPDGTSAVLGVFEKGELWTALVLRRRGAAFDLIAGPDKLRPDMGLLSGDWRRDYRHLCRAVELRYGEVGFGCFGERETLQALQIDPRPGAWGKAAALRDVVLSPMPRSIALALGFDGARYAARSLKELTERTLPGGALGATLHALRERAVHVIEERDVRRILGFDPLEVLRSLLGR